MTGPFSVLHMRVRGFYVPTLNRVSHREDTVGHWDIPRTRRAVRSPTYHTTRTPHHTLTSQLLYASCSFLAGSTATLSQKGAGSGLRTTKGLEQHNLLLSYAAIVCAAFVHCGLIPSLTSLSISAGSEELRAKAATL